MNRIHRFQVGEVVCTVLADGSAGYGMPGLMGRFPQVAEADLRAALVQCGADPDVQTTFYNTLLIEMGDHTILVDGGERRDRHDNAGFTVECLAEAGVAPADVDTVVITHAHGDHVIGLFAVEDNSLLYPNARFLIHKAEWDFWTDAERNAAIAPLLLKLADRVQFVDMDAEIVGGIRPISLHGHTVGHIGLLIESGGERFVHAVDLVHTPAQFPQPEWTVRFDTNPDQARATRLKMFAELADEGTLTMFYHMPFPGLGRVQRAGNGFAWQPIEE